MKFGTIPIAIKKGYKFVIIKFLAAGGEGCLLKKAIQKINTGQVDADFVRESPANSGMGETRMEGLVIPTKRSRDISSFCSLFLSYVVYAGLSIYRSLFCRTTCSLTQIANIPTIKVRQIVAAAERIKFVSIIGLLLFLRLLRSSEGDDIERNAFNHSYRRSSLGTKRCGSFG